MRMSSRRQVGRWTEARNMHDASCFCLDCGKRIPLGVMRWRSYSGGVTRYCCTPCLSRRQVGAGRPPLAEVA